MIITGTATRTCLRKTVGGTSITQILPGTATQAISGVIVVKFRDQNGVASAGDITCNGLEVEILD